ncbi:MAG TPA: PucR family transcriptional regulator [Motilibacteraceae bacterium]|nr:PucR family transcriptional regulator [Motilibacteraceae bacterium]
MSDAALLPTLRALVADPALRLRPLTGQSGLDRPVTWVAVSELEDPTPYLDGGELLLTTGLRGAADGTGSAGYVGRLVAAGVVGLGFGVGVVHEQVPPALVAAAREHGLPLLEVPRPTPFIAVGKAVGELLAAQRVRAAEERLRTVRSLAAAAGQAGPDLSPVLRRLARAVRGWAVLLSGDGAVTQAWPQGTAQDPPPLLRRAMAELAGHRLVAGSGSSEDRTGWCVVQPVGPEGSGARLACGGAEPAARDSALVGFAAALLGVAGARGPAGGGQPAERDGEDPTRVARSLVLELALRDGAAPAQLPAPVLGPFGEPRVRVAVVPAGRDVEPARRSGRELLSDVVREPWRVLVWAEAVDAAVLAALSDVEGGVSGLGAAGDVGALHTAARREAALARPGGGLRREDAVTGQPSVRELVPAPERAAFAAALLAPLRSGADLGEGSGDRAELLGSLRAYLRWNGHMDRAAAEAGVHRHTLRHRMARAGALLGVDLEDPQVRAELWLALAWLVEE